MTIKAKMLPETIAMTLYLGKQELNKTLFVTEEWHASPGVCEGKRRAPKSKAWKFKLSTGEKIAIAGVTISGIGLLLAGLNHFHRKQPAASRDQSGEGSGESGEANANAA